MGGSCREERDADLGSFLLLLLFIKIGLIL